MDGVTKDDIVLIKDLLKEVSKSQNETNRQMQQLTITVNDVQKAVIGDVAYGQKGLVKEIVDIKDYIEKDKQIKSKVVGGLVVVGIAWTLFLEFWKNVFK